MRSIFTIFEVLLFLQALYKCSYSQEDCNPYTKCATHTAGHMVVDPNDCHNYYICIQTEDGIVPSDNYYECNSGYYFLESYQECYYGSCTNECLNVCSIECTLYEYERVADPNDCSVFYTCRPEELKVKSQCPSEAPYFDGDSCTDSSYSCCDTCTPYCVTAYTEISDPFSCRNYYMCTSTGVPSESDKFSCPSFEVFDSSLGKCTTEDLSNLCVPLCSDSDTVANARRL